MAFSRVLVRSLRQCGRTRRQLFEELDAPLLMPLPTEPYVHAEWQARRVGLDYHVEVARHFYSVPHRYARQPVEATNGADGRDLHPRRSDRGSHARQRQWPAYDLARAHAVNALPVCRLDAREDPDRIWKIGRASCRERGGQEV